MWAASTAYTAGQVVKHAKNFYKCTTSGTSGSAGPYGTATSITDGTAVWRGAGPFENGFKIVNTGSVTAWLEIGYPAVAAGCDAILAGGVWSASIADPTLISVITASSTAVLAIAGLS